jgi:hypothetical protein
MNGLSVMKRTAPVSRYIRAVSSAMVFLSRNLIDIMSIAVRRLYAAMSKNKSPHAAMPQ